MTGYMGPIFLAVACHNGESELIRVDAGSYLDIGAPYSPMRLGVGGFETFGFKGVFYKTEDPLGDVRDGCGVLHRAGIGGLCSRQLWMLLTCSIKCVTGFGIQLFALGNLRHNYHRVRVYEPCFPG
jgi:hypothetical protein